MADQEELWGELDESTGGSFDDYVMVTQQAYFAPSETQPDKMYLHISGIGEGLPEEHQDRSHRYSVGPISSWTAVDQGKRLQNLVDPDAKIPARGLYGKFIAHAKKVPGLVEVLASRGSEKEAHIWEGLRIRMVATDFDYGINKETGEPIQTRRHMPTEFIGVVGEAPAGAAATDPALEAKVIAVRDSAKDFQAFLQKASQIPGVTDDDLLFAKVLDEQEGYWAERSK